MSHFRITYKTDENSYYDLIIPNAFEYNPDDTDRQDKDTRINTAAQEIMAQNAILTDIGNLYILEMIMYSTDDTNIYEMEDYEIPDEYDDDDYENNDED
jgi:hypothetical protein